MRRRTFEWPAHDLPPGPPLLSMVSIDGPPPPPLPPPPPPPASLSLVTLVLGDEDCHTSYDNGAAVGVYCALILYTFLGLAIVCDEYFVESLEQISSALRLSDDVAGATFMAAGSSAPELFTALITIFIAPGEQGVGTIVGSAVFNICVIIGLTSLGAGQVLQLWWYPLTRDSAVYAVSVLLMVWAMYDHQVSVFEASCLVGVYVLYVVLMVFNGAIVEALQAMRRRAAESSLEHRIDPIIKLIGMNPALKPVFRTSTYRLTSERRKENRAQLGGLILKARTIELARSQFLKLARKAHRQQEEEEEEEEAPPSPLEQAISIIGTPLSFAMQITVPDCREERWRRYYFGTFFMSILWIGILSFLMVDFAGRAGCILEVPEFLMGLVVLSVGTSVPDALSSLIVARNGQGNMAVCNVLGSNVFNILVGLGLPWLVAAYMQGAPYATGETSITEPALILFGYLFLLFVILIAFGWKLSPAVGVVLLMLQAVYWAWNISEEYGLISAALVSQAVRAAASQVRSDVIGGLAHVADGLAGSLSTTSR